MAASILSLRQSLFVLMGVLVIGLGIGVGVERQFGNAPLETQISEMVNANATLTWQIASLQQELKILREDNKTLSEKNRELRAQAMFGLQVVGAVGLLIGLLVVVGGVSIFVWLIARGIKRRKQNEPEFELLMD